MRTRARRRSAETMANEGCMVMFLAVALLALLMYLAYTGVPAANESDLHRLSGTGSNGW